MGENIREVIWKAIDTDLALKKDLGRDIINTRALARHLKKAHKLNTSDDAIISAIRRYNLSPEKSTKSAYQMLKQARVSTRTKMSSLLLKRADDVKTAMGRPDKIIDYQMHEVVRIIEGKEALTLIFDQKNLEKMTKLFSKKVILKTNKKIGMIEINYPLALEKTPGVFNTISTELAANNISITDAVISPNEHIIIVEEDKLLKAFEVVHKLTT